MANRCQKKKLVFVLTNNTNHKSCSNFFGLFFCFFLLTKMTGFNVKRMMEYIGYGSLIGLVLCSALFLYRVSRRYVFGTGMDTIALKDHQELQNAVAGVRLFYFGEMRVYKDLVTKLDGYMEKNCSDKDAYYELCKTIREYTPACFLKKRPLVQKMVFDMLLNKFWIPKKTVLLSLVANTYIPV